MPEHAASITALLLERRMCVDCIGEKTALSNAAVESYLTIMSRVLAIQEVEAECGGCGAVTAVVSVERLR
jgi:hypothetical protein